ncbi:ribosomal protein L31 [Paenibacillus sp. HGF5]|nr:ribosomal protein L31 [Paenibacillus sp. HGF5]
MARKEENITMQKGIHPTFQKVIFLDASVGFSFLSASTKTSTETMEWEDGHTYPVIRVDSSSASHPFFTGKQKNTEIGGRVDKFKKRLSYKR